MRITEASGRLSITPRMLRYREALGLLPGVRARSAAGLHRQFGAADLDAVALGLAIEQRYDISPAELAFGLRVLADPAARAQVAELGRRIGRIRPLPAMAMDFEKERALRLLGNPAGPPAAARRQTGQAQPGRAQPGRAQPARAQPARAQPGGVPTGPGR
jgi:MerR family copper efflux transcriptional regulator